MGEGMSIAGSIKHLAALGLYPAGLAGNNAALSYKSFKNFKPSNTRRIRRGLGRVIAGQGNCYGGVIGDSTQAGDGAGTGTNGFDGARVLTPSRRLSDILNKSLVTSQEVGIFGSAGVQSGAPAQYLTYDPRVAMPSGWSLTSAGIGGGYYDNSTTTNPLSFAPGVAFNTIDYLYAQTTGLATFTIDVDGGAAIETVNAAGSGAIVRHTVTCPLGAHTINWRRTGVGANLRILGCTVYNSAVKTVDIWNLSVAGATSSSWSLTTNPWSPLNALPALGLDFAFLDIGINDWIGGVDPAVYTTNMQSIINVLSPTTDVILCNPNPSAIATNSLSQQMTIVNALAAIQVANDLPLIDFRNQFETQEIATSGGFWYSGPHPNALGYVEKGRLMARALREVA
jgi:lysophospholipase L1-like esterase